MNAETQLARNEMQVVRLARRMRLAIIQRLEHGDTGLVGKAVEDMIRPTGWSGKKREIEWLLDWLSRCNASQWLNFIMVDVPDQPLRHMGWKNPSDLLKIATGMNRQEWLDLERETRV